MGYFKRTNDFRTDNGAKLSQLTPFSYKRELQRRLCFFPYRLKASLPYFALLLSLFNIVFIPNLAFARDISYTGSEEKIYVSPGEPTQITFPGKVSGGFFASKGKVSLKKEGSFIVLFAQPGLAPSGEVVILFLEDERSYSLRVLPAGVEQARDDAVKIIDDRDPEIELEQPKGDVLSKETPFAPPSVVSGLMREMMLVAEFGKKKGIPGYRRSNRYSGEEILNNGAIEAKIDEIFMGADHWGYVLTVTNLLDTTQQLNPATFRLDGTKAIAFQNIQLAPRPQTAEQKISNKHQVKAYIVTRSKRN